VLVGEEAPLFALDGTDIEALSAPAFRAVQPGELLARRPDIRAAEAQIAAAAGDVAAARAAFLPSLSITARALLESGSGGGPLQAVLAAGAGMLAPIFDGGRLKGRLTTVSGEQQEAVETYRRTILTALREGEDAMTALEGAQRRLDLLGRTIAEARTAARLARLQFLEGAADLQTVFDAERGLLDLEEARALAAQDRLNASIDLYKAMGGEPAGARPGAADTA
jgi:outer membrane protein TolC